jgi:PAS domain-containing protein
MATFDANSLKCNYVNGRIEDFLGFLPEDVASSGGTLFDSIIAPASRELYRTMVQDLIIAPHGEIARGEIQFKTAEGGELSLKYGIVVVSRTAIGEAEEILLVATPGGDCA